VSEPADNPLLETGSQSRSIADGATILLLMGLIATGAIAATWTGPSSESVLWQGLATAGRAAMVVVVWGLAAAGFGIWSLRWLPGSLLEEVGPATRLLAALGLGIPILLWLATALGSIGILDQVTGWGLVILGAILVGVSIRQADAKNQIGLIAGWLPKLCWTGAPALAILLLASTSAPGWLWRSEFGGYDVLSYHLQLPREWFEAGRIFTPTWNIYGALPSLVEAGYFHLMVLEDTALGATFAAQQMHACCALLTAATTGAAIGRWLDPGRIGIGFALLIGTPWVIVVGSLAYDEMAAALMLATAMLLLVPSAEGREGMSSSDRFRTGLAAGVLAGGACAMKLTSVGLIAVPIVYLLIRRLGNRGWRDAIPAGAIGGFLMLLPWLIRNFVTTGNPVFPFGAALFGTGHYTPEQLVRFMSAHASSDDLVERVVQFKDQFLMYGFGANPVEGEPWRPQWSLLPILAFAGLLIGFLRRSTRRITRDLLILVMFPCIFWLAATHLKSRFLVPAIPAFVTAAVLIVPDGLNLDTRRSLAWRIPIGIILLAWCLLPVWLFMTEREIEGAPAPATMVGRLDLVTGLAQAEAIRGQTDNQAIAEIIMAGGPNTLFTLIPEEERILSLGNAAPFLSPRGFTYSTVWDEHVLTTLQRQHPDDPGAVVEGLRERGFTLLLVNRAMLENWSQSGWLDPTLENMHIAPILELLDLEFGWPNGELLYRIPNRTELAP
jgi:hypothetical protein